MMLSFADWSSRARRSFLLITVALAASACSSADTSTMVANGEQLPMANGEISANTGKADGQNYSIRDYFKHNRDLPIDDLLDRTASLATDGINLALSRVPFVDLKLSETTLFGLNAGSEGGSNISDLSALVNGLLARFGDEDFVTQINQVRAQHLATSPDAYFAETEFKVGTRADFNFAVDGGDFDVNLGFDPGAQLKARAVFAYPDNVDAILNNPLKAFSEARGFVLPRDIDDLRALLPGESIQLSGKGVAGFNLGANLPIFSISPVDHLVLTSRFHLGARVQTHGELDIQVIRGSGSDLFIDVGMANIRNRSFKAAFQSGWGLEGIPPILEVAVGPKVFSLGDIAEKFLEQRISRSGLLSYGAEGLSSSANERRSIQRFKIDVNVSSVEMDAAVTQALAGDLRLMQTLADRQTRGITEVASFERALNQRRRKLGAHFASMKFYTETTERDGVIVVSSNGMTDEILFEELEERRGRFWKDLGFKRLLLTSQSWLNGEYQGAKSNVRLTVTESDKYTERDQILDHVDAALLSVMDFETIYVGLTRSFEELQHEVDENCRHCENNSNPNESDSACMDRCKSMLITPSRVQEWQGQLQAQIDQTVRGLKNTGYNANFSRQTEIAQQLLALKLNLSSSQQSMVALADLTGETFLMSDVRITQKGINEMFRATTPDKFRQQLENILTLIVSNRSKEYDKKYDKATRWLDGESDKLDDMVAVYAAARDQYLTADDSAGIGVGSNRLGDGGVLLVNGGTDDDVIPATMSLAAQKGKVVADMIDALVEKGQELGLIQAILKIISLGLVDLRAFESHHLIAYTLTTLVAPEHREWLVSMDFEENAFSDIRLYSRGTNEEGLIAPGEFDLDKLLAQ